MTAGQAVPERVPHERSVVVTSAWRGISPVTTAILLGCVLLSAPLVVPLATGRIFTFQDLTWFHLPMRFLYQRALQSGGSFLWMSDLNSGLFLHAEGQVGMAHPLHLLAYRVLPLWAAMNVEILFSYAAAFCGMWCFLRRLPLKNNACLFGALAFAFCGFNVMHLNHVNSVAIAVHIPWLLWSADVLMTSADRGSIRLAFAVCAISIGSQLLLGHPQYIWMTLVAILWWVAYRLIEGASIRRVGWLILAGLIGGFIGAVQVLPTLDAVESSFRATPPMDFRLSFSLHPLNLIQLWSPYAFRERVYATVPMEIFPHELALYDGALATASLAWIGLRWRELANRRLIVALLALAGFGLLLALGRYGGVYSLLAHLPGIASFRAPARHIVLVHLALAGIVAAVVDDLADLGVHRTSLDWRRLWPLTIPLALSVLTCAILLTVAHSAAKDRLDLSRDAAQLAGPALMIATVALLALAARGWRAALPLLLVVAALDLALWGIRYVWLGRPADIASLGPDIPSPPGAVPGDYIYATFRPDQINRFPLRGLRPTAAYVALPTEWTLDPADVTAQRIAGVRWAWRSNRWTRVANTMPRARLVTDVRVSHDVVSDIAAVDIARTALVDAPLDVSLGGEPGQARILDERPGRIVVGTNAERPQLLVLTERFHRGWKAVAAGKPIPVRAVYGDYLGCVVPAGSQRVTFMFAPASVRIGLQLSVAGLALLAGACMVIARRH